MLRRNPYRINEASPKIYEVKWSDNHACRMRGHPTRPDKIEIQKFRAANDLDALRKIALEFAYDYYDDLEDDEKREVDDAISTREGCIEALDQIDFTGGDPFVFWIRRGKNNYIYDSEIEEYDQ